MCQNDVMTLAEVLKNMSVIHLLSTNKMQVLFSLHCTLFMQPFTFHLCVNLRVQDGVKVGAENEKRTFSVLTSNVATRRNDKR